MTQATQRAAINTIVSGVTGIGQVYSRQRWAVRWEDVLALLKTTIGGTDQIRAWMITCLGHRDEYLNAELTRPQGAVAIVRTWRWRIQGFVTFNDGDNTEEEALNLATSVVNAMTLAASLHSGDVYWGEQPPAQLDIFELRTFAGVLCHYAEISQELAEVVGLKSS